MLFTGLVEPPLADAGGLGHFDWLVLVYFALLLAAAALPTSWWWARVLALLWPAALWLILLAP